MPVYQGYPIGVFAGGSVVHKAGTLLTASTPIAAGTFPPLLPPSTLSHPTLLSPPSSSLPIIVYTYTLHPAVLFGDRANGSPVSNVRNLKQ